MRSRLRSSVVYIGLRMCVPSLLTSSSFIVFFLGRLTVTGDHRGSLDRVELAYLLDIGLPSVNSGGPVFVLKVALLLFSLACFGWIFIFRYSFRWMG